MPAFCVVSKGLLPFFIIRFIQTYDFQSVFTKNESGNLKILRQIIELLQ